MARKIVLIIIFILGYIRLIDCQTISINYQNESLRTVLRELTTKTDFRFIFEDELIDEVSITAKCDSCPFETAVNHILKNTSLTWQRQGKQIVLINRLQLPRDISFQNAVKGFVRNHANGETMAYVNIVIAGINRGTVSDENGYYVITKIPNGSFTIKAMMMGYTPVSREVDFAGDRSVTLDFNMNETVIEMQQIIKTAERERFEREINPSMIQLKSRAMTAAPAFVEADLFRTLQSLPAINAFSDLSSALYIRGGNPSENSILLDDVRIYNPYHFGGMFSAFNVDAIKNVDVSIGGFPPRYGNAISSVISVTNKDGNSKEFAARGSVSLLSSKITMENPIPHGSMLISARRTYFDAIYNWAVPPSDKIPYYFYDFHAKVNYDFSTNSKLTLSGYYGDDIMKAEEDKEDNELLKNKLRFRFGNYCTSLKWRYIFNPRLFSEIILAGSKFRTDLDIPEEELKAGDTIDDLTLKSDFTWFLSDHHEIKFGLDLQQLNFALYYEYEGDCHSYYKNRPHRANFYSTYLQDNWNISSLCTIQGGLRFTYYDLGDYVRLEPRLNFRYRALPNLNVKASFGVFHQCFYTLNPEQYDYLRLVDLWFPIDARYQPVQAIHYIGGLEYWLNDDVNVSLEGYYKSYDNLLAINEFGNLENELDDFLIGHGQAAGLDLMLKKQTGRWLGWLGYNLAYVDRTIATARPSNHLPDKKFKTDYETYNPQYDCRHSLKFVAQYQGEKWQFGTSLMYRSGLPQTPQIGWQKRYELDMNGHPTRTVYNIPIMAEKGSRRLPSYFRIDASVMRKYQFKKWSLQPFFQVVNVTNHKNISFYDYDIKTAKYDDNGEILYNSPRRQPVWLSFPIIPTIGVNFEF